jgi:hypothetical protein
MSSGRSWPLHEPLGRLAQLTRSAFGHHASGGGGEEEKKMPPVRQVPTSRRRPLISSQISLHADALPQLGLDQQPAMVANPFTRSVTRQVPEIGRPPKTQPGMRPIDRVYVVRAAPSLRLVIFFSRPVQRECRKKAATEEQCTWRTPLFPVPRVIVASPPARTSTRCRGEGGIPSVTPASRTSVGHRPPAPLRTTQAYFSHRQPATHCRPTGGLSHLCGPSVTDTEPTVAGERD